MDGYPKTFGKTTRTATDERACHTTCKLALTKVTGRAAQSPRPGLRPVLHPLTSLQSYNSSWLARKARWLGGLWGTIGARGRFNKRYNSKRFIMSKKNPYRPRSKPLPKGRFYRAGIRRGRPSRFRPYRTQRSTTTTLIRQPRPLAYPPYRKVIVMRKVPFLRATTNLHTVDFNGAVKVVAHMVVSPTPFATRDTHGTTRYRNAIGYYGDGVNTSVYYPDAGGEDLGDIVAICQRYQSVRIAGMRVELEILTNPMKQDGTTETWINSNAPEIQWDTCWIPGDTEDIDPTAGFYPRTVTPDELARLPGHKRITNKYAIYGVNGGKGVYNWRLMDRRFRVMDGRNTVTTSATDAGSVAVYPGEWDHRAAYVSTLDNAYDTLSDPNLVAGKLHIIAHMPWSHITGTEGWYTAGGQNLMGWITTYHEIHLKGDVAAFGPAAAP